MPNRWIGETERQAKFKHMGTCTCEECQTEPYRKAVQVLKDIAKKAKGKPSKIDSSNYTRWFWK